MMKGRVCFNHDVKKVEMWKEQFFICSSNCVLELEAVKSALKTLRLKSAYIFPDDQKKNKNCECVCFNSAKFIIKTYVSNTFYVDQILILRTLRV
jgi:hypothetical protein